MRAKRTHTWFSSGRFHYHRHYTGAHAEFTQKFTNTLFLLWCVCLVVGTPFSLHKRENTPASPAYSVTAVIECFVFMPSPSTYSNFFIVQNVPMFRRSFMYTLNVVSGESNVLGHVHVALSSSSIDRERFLLIMCA